MEVSSPKPQYVKVDGLLLPPFKLENIRQALDYKPKSDDLFIATYPKCGTTWMQNIVLYIFRKGQELENPQDFHVLTPFIDGKGSEGIENMPRPGAFKTHLPFTHIPYSANAKYIYVLRNPKDCCVSMYYHTVRGHRSFSEGTFDQFFELFMAGEVEYNDYFDHLMSWYPHIRDENVLFVTYEDMKEDAREVVLKVAGFLGKEYIDAIEEDNNVLNNILHFSGFDYMKEHLSEIFRHGPKRNKTSTENGEKEKVDDQPLPKEKVGFMRKGVVGDWKNHLSDEQSARMNKKFSEITQGTEIYDIYKSYMTV